MVEHSFEGIAPGKAAARTSGAAAAWTTVSLLALIAVLSWLDRLILSMLVIPIEHDLGLTDGEFGLLLGIGFVGVYVLAGLPIATALDRGNRKWILVGAVIVWCLSTIAAGLVQSFAMLAFARSGVAIGEAALMPAAVSMISDLFPHERRRAPTSVFMAVNILGATGAFVIGGAVIAAFDRLGMWNGLPSWRLTLIAVGLLGLPLIGLFALVVREPPRLGGANARMGATATLAHLRAHAPLYLCTFAGVGLLGMIAQGSVAWLPTLLARGYELRPAQVGAIMASTFAPASILGVGLLPVMIGRRQGRPLVLRVLTLLLLACVLAGPFAILAARSSLSVLVAAGALSAIGQGSLVALVAILVQSVTPGPMRARMMALFFLILNLLSSGLAPTAVAWTAAQLFAGSRALGGGLAVVSACGAGGGALLLLAAFAWSRKHDFART